MRVIVSPFLIKGRKTKYEVLPGPGKLLRRSVELATPVMAAAMASI
jgi:hypothetical protein